ncbi:MAG: hypothetical protein CBD74_06745 [Saprospirales bacterium TMED214]|nr:MAG: hypothetical protein CBD74_06745 [Saprospirales bacterium TMED214]
MQSKTIDVIWHRRGRKIDVCNWSIEQYAHHWRNAGWTVRHQYGIPLPWRPPALLTVMHVDLSVVPRKYEAWATKNSANRVIWNARMNDIRKSRVSSHLLTRHDSWDGPVILKTEYNCGARPEGALKSPLKKQTWRDAGNPQKQEYVVKNAMSEVPAWAWNSPHWVVERYFEAVEAEYSIWTLTILGTELELVRFTADSQLDYERGQFDQWVFEQIDGELNKIVCALSIEYGRLDLLRVNGSWVLLDVNKTPGQYPRQDAAKARRDFYDQRIETLAKSVLAQFE